MGQAAAYKEVMRHYETAQNDAMNLRDRREANLYQTLPRVRDIEREMAKLGLSLARMVLQPSTASVEATRAAYERLAAEKAALLQSAGIPDDYLTDIYQCAVCQDTGYINKHTANAERCACLKQRLIDQYYTMSNLGEVLARENFGAFRANYFCEVMQPDEGLSPRKNMELIRKESERFVQDLTNHSSNHPSKDFAKPVRNLLFYGATGLGKTFLCHCIAKAALDAGLTVLYVTAPRLFKLIQAQQFNRQGAADADEKLDAVQDADLLILDDLGAEFSNIITDSALFDVVNQRLLDGRATVISTNLTLGELEEQYTERIVSRFIGNFKWFRFFGEDLRKKQSERLLEV